jgi:hypothetical protein
MQKRDGYIEAANGKVTDIHTASVPVESLDAEVSITTVRLEVADSETSADELALDDEEICTSFSKRPRREPPETNERTEFRGRSLGTGRS